MTNFRDPITKEEFYFPSYRAVIKDDASVVYTDKYKGELLNPATGTALELIPTEGPITVPYMAKFNPNTAEGQRSIKSHFGKTATHDSTKGAGRDERDQRQTDFKKELGVRKKKGNLPL
jgi:hypothetical protein